jgi:hypothetical protein
MKTTLLLTFFLSIHFVNRIYSQNLTQDTNPTSENLSQKFVYSFLSSIDQVKVSTIKDFALKRQGVVLCEINAIEKTIAIGIDNSLNVKSANYLMDVIRKNFLDSIDAPKEKDVHNHKH